MNQVKALLRQLKAGRWVLLQSLKDLTQEEIEEQLVTDEWTVRDVLGHVAAWEAQMSLALESLIGEREPEYATRIDPADDFRAWNAEQAAVWRQLPLGEVMSRLVAEHARFVNLVQSLQDRELERCGPTPWQKEYSVAEIVEVEARHEEEHAKQILAWRESIGKPLSEEDLKPKMRGWKRWG